MRAKVRIRFLGFFGGWDPADELDEVEDEATLGGALPVVAETEGEAGVAESWEEGGGLAVAVALATSARRGWVAARANARRLALAPAGEAAALTAAMRVRWEAVARRRRLAGSARALDKESGRDPTHRAPAGTASRRASLSAGGERFEAERLRGRAPSMRTFSLQASSTAQRVTRTSCSSVQHKEKSRAEA